MNMKIKFREQYSKPCWEVKTPKEIPIARIIKENDVPDIMEYNSELVSGKLTLMREREAEFSNWEQLCYWWYGYRTLEDMIRKKYNLGYRYFEIINNVLTPPEITLTSNKDRKSVV